MADWKCDCGGTYQATGGDFNPRDTKVHMKCDKCGDKFMAFWMNPDYAYTIKCSKRHDDGSPGPRVQSNGPPISPDTISYPVNINPNRCDNCGYTKIKEEDKCPVCRYLLHPTDEQRKERDLKKVRWGCYKSDFHGFTHKQCQAMDCNTCRYGG